MTYNVEIKIKRGMVTPDLFSWLEDHGKVYNKDWRFEKPVVLDGKPDFDYKFKFVRSEDAMMFSLRWA